MKYIKGISQKTIEEEALWVVKYDYRPREVIKGKDVPKVVELNNKAVDDGDEYSPFTIRDLDWLSYDSQPEELKPFFDWYSENEATLPFRIKDIFNQYGEDM